MQVTWFARNRGRTKFSHVHLLLLLLPLLLLPPALPSAGQFIAARTGGRTRVRARAENGSHGIAARPSVRPAE